MQPRALAHAEILPVAHCAAVTTFPSLGTGWCIRLEVFFLVCQSASPSGSMEAQLFLAPGASTKKASAAVGKALAGGALRHSGWAWGDVAAYEAEVNALPRFLVDTGLACGALMLCWKVKLLHCLHSMHSAVCGLQQMECCTCAGASAQSLGLIGTCSETMLKERLLTGVA